MRQRQIYHFGVGLGIAPPLVCAARQHGQRQIEPAARLVGLQEQFGPSAGRPGPLGIGLEQLCNIAPSRPFPAELGQLGPCIHRVRGSGECLPKGTLGRDLVVMPELQQCHEVEGIGLRRVSSQCCVGEPLRGLHAPCKELRAPHDYLRLQDFARARRHIRERLHREVGVAHIEMRLCERDGHLVVGRRILLRAREHCHGPSGLMHRRQHTTDAQQIERLALILRRACQCVDNIGRGAGCHEEFGQRQTRLGVRAVCENRLLETRRGIALSLRYDAAADEGQGRRALRRRGCALSLRDDLLAECARLVASVHP